MHRVISEQQTRALLIEVDTLLRESEKPDNILREMLGGDG